jgi:5-methylcytosine-specific restriction protein A
MGSLDQRTCSAEKKGCMSPFASKHPCSYPGCTALTGAARCDRHRKQDRKEHEKRRGHAAARGYGHNWRIASKAFLAHNPLCIECLKQRRLVAATVIDHIIPHKGNSALFWNQDNWQALCKRCHSRKTAISDGRWV